ncbi:alpha/beta hydrolase family protein [Alteromonas sp. CYL-A6]|uniref:alpha/beta hydrolase family protein n=1 Tax=Alteromonas nitratireducens TaxID=3390813 RepID=UPI0034BC3333
MILITIGLVVLVIATSWYSVYGLKPYHVSSQDISERYSYVQPDPIDLVQSQLDSCCYSFTYKSFDGENVNGQLHLPADIKHTAESIPVLIGMHAMGRSHERWFKDSIGGRKTVENTHKITELALKKGYAVVAIDARKHGKRKDPKQSVNNIISDMHRWGKREPYENMLVDTVKDL